MRIEESEEQKIEMNRKQNNRYRKELPQPYEGHI